MFFTLMRTEARDIIGLLDEAFWNNGEDYCFNRRVYLTCRNCNKRKYDHSGDEFRCDYEEGGNFQPYAILTCTHSLVHHQCGVTKHNMAVAKETTGYDLVVKAKNIFNGKWGTEEVKDPDIYGKTGNINPDKWTTEIDL